MARGPLYELGSEYKPQFSGHETFPLRYGWLKKAFDAVTAESNLNDKSIFLDENAIAQFGVGKNMVASMRHWASSIGFITKDGLKATQLGISIFGANGLDPYLEHPSTLWLIHWNLCGHPDKTTWFWVFNYFYGESFEREHLVSGLEKLAKDRSWNKVASATIKRDVECFVRTYAAKATSTKAIYEDSLESPLAELGLIKPIGKRDGFRLVRGTKSSLGKGVFLYALADFWERFSPNTNTLSFEAIAHEPGSPGRVFLLNENDLFEYLTEINAQTNETYRWSETAGLKQVLRNKKTDLNEIFKYLKADYLAQGL
ncbi:MAG: DUF4007 family protein [Chlorobium sp.]|nr:DUF4007 family protein [Chlorobium sp.]